MRRQAQMKPDVLFAFADEPLLFQGIHQPSVTAPEPCYAGQLQHHPDSNCGIAQDSHRPVMTVMGLTLYLAL